MSDDLYCAECLAQAARLAYKGESLDMADLLCRESMRLGRKSVVGVLKTPELMRRIDALTVVTCEVQADLMARRRMMNRAVSE